MVDQATRYWNGMVIPAPGVYFLDEAHKRIGFLAQHMMVSPVRGEFSEASATILVAEDPLQSSVSASIGTASVNTHNKDRDTHLSGPDFLDVERYPTIEYRSTKVTWQGDNDPIFQWARLRNNRVARRGATTDLPRTVTRTSGRFLLAGHLTIKNVTLPVDLQMEFGGARRDPTGRDIFGFSASAEINRESFGLLWNVALETGGVLVGKNVRIEIAGEAIRQD
jgi:polyisoprenoid-binding protein YceI